MSIEHLKTVTRTARKQHRCDYCGNCINRGEKYEISTLRFEGELYEWKMHPECDDLASWLQDYIDPDEGITEDDFRDACSDVCQTFVCPDCEQYQKCDGDVPCEEYGPACIRKIWELSRKYYLSRKRSQQSGWWEWRLVPINERG